MKRVEAVKGISWIIDDEDLSYNKALRILSYLEDLGMEPPLSEIKVVEDPNRLGTMKHTESKREWEDHE